MGRAVASPLSNTDTYFHLRFGEEFLHGWSLRHPGSVSTLRHRLLGADAVAARGGDGPHRPVAGPGRGRLAVRADDRRADGDAVPLGAPLVRAAALRGPHLPRPARRLQGPLDAAAGAQLPAGRRHHRRMAPHPRRQADPLVARPADVGLGDGARHVADRDRDRRRRRRRAWPWTARSPARCWRELPSCRCSRRSSRPSRPSARRLYAGVLGVGSRSQYFSEWGPPDYTTFSCLVLGFMLALAVVLMLRHGVRSYLDIALFLVAAVCAVWSWRTVPVAAMMLVPFVAVQAHAGRHPARDAPAPRTCPGGRSERADARRARRASCRTPPTSRPPSRPGSTPPSRPCRPARRCSTPGTGAGT